MTTKLNYYCLEHLFTFLTPKDWVHFAQVCQEWKSVATSSKYFQEFAFIPLHLILDEESDDKKLEPSEFFKIFNLVAPELKYVRFKRNSDEKTRINTFSVSFGHFTYFTKLSKPAEEIIIEKFLTQTKKVKQLKLNAFTDTTKSQWEKFFRTNPLEHFKFIPSKSKDIDTFLNSFISILPNSVEQIGFRFGENWLSDEEEQSLIQLLRRISRLTKVHFTQEKPFSVAIATEIANHAKTIKELCIEHRLYDLPASIFEDNEEDFEVIDLVAKLTNLTKLNLTGFALREDQCKKIVANCQSIRCLKIVNCDVPEPCLRVLMTLPNLTELHVDTNAMNFTTEMTGLRNLVIYNYDEEFNEVRLAEALNLMPNLSSLSMADDNSLTEHTARIIKQTAHSRGQTISVYSQEHTYRVKTFQCTKVDEFVPSFAPKGVLKLVTVFHELEDDEPSWMEIMKEV